VILDFANPLKNARIVSENTNDADYHEVNRGRKRGDKDWVMTRSQLVAFHACPNKWITEAGGDEGEKSAAFRFGSLVDCLVLTPQFYGTRYAIAPGVISSKRVNAWKEFEANALESGRTAILAIEHSEAVECAGALLRDFPLIASAKKQVWVTAEYHDKKTGVIVPVQVLLDLVPDAKGKDAHALADLKTALSADPEGWSSVTKKYNYHVQAALYSDAYNAATEEDRTSWYHCVAESSFPYQTAGFRLADSFLEIGREKYVSALRDYAECIATGIWPGYELRCQTLNGWMQIEPKAWMLVDGAGRGEMADMTAPTPSVKVSGDFIP